VAASSGASSSRVRLHALGVLAWFVLSFVAVLWSQGLRPVAFAAPDEALNRSAALVISTTGKPFLSLPFEDPENLAHARSWLSVGTHAIPVYTPVSIYVYALFTYLGTFGLLLLAAMPASAVAALAAGTSRLLQHEHRSLGLLAPALGMPVLYWLLRPWMNISAMLVCLCWAVYFWSRYRERKQPAWLVATFVSAGLAAAIRPDYTAYLLSAVLLFAAGAEPKRWKTVALLTVAAGGLAVALNLPLNLLITGKATRFAYQMEFEHEDGPPDDAPAPIRLLGMLLYPLGVPSPGTVVRLLWKYWVLLVPIAAVTLGQAALWPLFRQKDRLERWLHGLALLAILMFLTSRMDPTTFGAANRTSELHHSIVRYFTPVYLLSPIAPLWWLARQSGRRLLIGVSIAAVVGVLGVAKVVALSPQSLSELRANAEEADQRADRLGKVVPKNGMIYGRTTDRLLWSRYRVGFLDDLEPTAASLARALKHDIPTFVLLRPKDKLPPLEQALGKHELALVKIARIDADFTLYRVGRAQSRSAR
jgi:hypothetical protein